MLLASYKDKKPDFKKLFKFSHNTVHELLELLQYFTIYAVFAFIGGFLMDHIFPDFDEDRDNIELIVEVLAQIVIGLVLLHYLKIFARYIPFFLKYKQSYQPSFNKASKIGADAGLGLIFMGMQTDLFRKMEYLKDYYLEVLS
jgi:hypothetical protein